MDQEKVETRTELNGYQLAGLAVVASTVAALAVLYIVRLLGIVGPQAMPDGGDTQPAVPHAPGDGASTHFSEELLVPGLTYSGVEVEEQDRTEGRSPEGV
jgi:hypothetical protein